MTESSGLRDSRPNPDRGNARSTALTRVVNAILPPVLTIYFLGMAISVPYFNWCYARDHGFVSWIFFGEIVPTLQGCIWPYYALSSGSRPSWTDEERQNLEHFHRSRDATQQAVRIIDSGPSDRPSELRKDESDAIVSLHRLALAEARQVDLDTLAKAHPALPEHYRDEYLEYLKSMNRLYSGDDNLQDQFAAHKLHDKWVDWINANKGEIHLPKRATSR